MVCVEATCITPCSTAGDKYEDDALCGQLSPLLTCSETASDHCALRCGRRGACPATYTCKDPGDNIHYDENACLLTGSFPGSPWCKHPDGSELGHRPPALLAGATPFPFEHFTRNRGLCLHRFEEPSDIFR